MVPNLTAFVLLACACVTINAIVPPLQQACMKIRKGFTAGHVHYVKPIILPQGQIPDWEMPIPKCLGETGGVDVLACDDDKIPAIKFTESSTVVVHKTGSPDSYIVVRFTLYCLSPQGQLVSGKPTTVIVKDEGQLVSGKPTTATVKDQGQLVSGKPTTVIETDQGHLVSGKPTTVIETDQGQLVSGKPTTVIV